MTETAPLLPADPKASYLAHKEEIDAAIRRVLESGRYILGEEVAGFEREFADYLGVRHAIGVGSGTEALHLALRACGIGPGCAVITVSHTAVATVAAIELAGATPVLVDIDPATYTMDPERLEGAIRHYRSRRGSSRRGELKAVVAVHLYGLAADMPAIAEVARRYDLSVIEDCAQSHGSTLLGRRTGSWGRLSAFSFYPTKNLGALGDAGALVTDDPELAESTRRLREYGWGERYVSASPGMNSRLDEIQAAVLRVKLRHLDAENERRVDLARIYDAGLRGTSLTLPRGRAGATHVYHQYVVQTDRRDDLKSFLDRRRVRTAVHYPVPVHLQPAYAGRVVVPEPLACTEKVAPRVLSLPMYADLGEDRVRTVVACLNDWASRGQADD